LCYDLLPVLFWIAELTVAIIRPMSLALLQWLVLVSAADCLYRVAHKKWSIHR